MKKIINGARYDTDTAKKLGFSQNSPESDLDWYEEALYRTKSGKYFIHGVGGPRTKYASPRGDGGWCSGEAIVPISEDAARQWAEKKLPADEFEMVFGEVSEDVNDIQATVYIPAALAAKLYAKLDEENCSRNELILKALREYLK